MNEVPPPSSKWNQYQLSKIQNKCNFFVILISVYLNLEIRSFISLNQQSQKNPRCVVLKLVFNPSLMFIPINLLLISVVFEMPSCFRETFSSFLYSLTTYSQCLFFLSHRTDRLCVYLSSLFFVAVLWIYSRWLLFLQLQ